MNNYLRIAAAIALILMMSAVSARAGSFYLDILDRGRADFDRADYARAAGELRTAAFGLLDDTARYEIANVYLAVASLHSGRTDDASAAIRQIALAERIAPTYQRLDLPAAIRDPFEAALPKLFTVEQIASMGPFWAPVEKPAVQTSTNIADLRAMVVQNPHSLPLRTALAEAEQAAGNDDQAIAIANDLLHEDEKNASAHLVLARSASARKDFATAIEHYARVVETRPLTDRDTGRLFIAFVGTGRFADAAKLQERLTIEERKLPEVARAIIELNGAAVGRTDG